MNNLAELKQKLLIKQNQNKANIIETPKVSSNNQ
jgi:hypothetical protein